MVVVIMLTFLVLIMSGLKREHLTGQAVLKMVWLEKAVIYGCQYTSDYICSVWMGFGKEGIDKGKTTSQYKAYPGKVVQTLLNHLQSKGSQKSYPDQPDDVEQAAMVKGIYAYVSPSEGMSEDMIIQAWFKKGTAPTQSVDSDVFNLSELTSFDVNTVLMVKVFHLTLLHIVQKMLLLMRMLPKEQKHLVKLFIQLL